MFSKLQCISKGAKAKQQINNIQEALDAGSNGIQLRFINATTEGIKALAVQGKKVSSTYAATFIINDHSPIAKDMMLMGCTWLTRHAGYCSKKIIEDKIISGTANTLDDALIRVDEGCNYIGLVPFRFTTTKENLSSILGLEGYKKIIAELE